MAFLFFWTWQPCDRPYRRRLKVRWRRGTERWSSEQQPNKQTCTPSKKRNKIGALLLLEGRNSVLLQLVHLQQGLSFCYLTQRSEERERGVKEKKREKLLYLKKNRSLNFHYCVSVFIADFKQGHLFCRHSLTSCRSTS